MTQPDPHDLAKPDPPPGEEVKPASEVGIDTRRIVEIKSKADRDAAKLVLWQICDDLGIKLDECDDGDGRRTIHEDPAQLREMIIARHLMHGVVSARNELGKLCRELGIDDRTEEDKGLNGFPPTAEGFTLAVSTLRRRIKSHLNSKPKSPTPRSGWLFDFFRGLFS